MERRLAAAKKLQAAIEPLYAKLDAKQKKTADQVLARADNPLLDIALELERIYIRARKISKDEEALRWMLRQYGGAPPARTARGAVMRAVFEVFLAIGLDDDGDARGAAVFAKGFAQGGATLFAQGLAAIAQQQFAKIGAD